MKESQKRRRKLIQQIQQEGYEAAAAGKHRQTCPYNLMNSYQWLQGYDSYSNPELLKENYQNREVGTGKYTFDGGLERLCECGHSLGVHAGARVKTDNGIMQDCFNGQPGVPGATGEDCKCLCFTPAPKKAAA